MENKRNHIKTKTELAGEWFGSKSYLEQHELSDKYFESRHPSLLTIEQVEQIYHNEVIEPQLQESWQESQVNQKYPKPNQKQIADEIIDLVGENQFKEIIKESNKRVNQKQFKEFNPELFKSYISKFSDEDKVRAMVVLLENQKEEYKFNCFLAALKQMDLDSTTHSNIMTLVALKDI